MPLFCENTVGAIDKIYFKHLLYKIFVLFSSSTTWYSILIRIFIKFCFWLTRFFFLYILLYWIWTLFPILFKPCNLFLNAFLSVTQFCIPNSFSAIAESPYNLDPLQIFNKLLVKYIIYLKKVLYKIYIKENFYLSKNLYIFFLRKRVYLCAYKQTDRRNSSMIFRIL